MIADLAANLQSHFGFSAFRPGQSEAVQSLLQGQHTLVVMPTDAGKSLIYQLSALHQPGLTLVISPLIALMKDQVDHLKRRGIPSTFINSTLSSMEQEQRLRMMAAGEYKLVYIAPERLRSLAFLDVLQCQKVCLLAVDEAHCISEWGHDFRPNYLQIGRFRADLGNPVTAALTATATPKVQNDIVRHLDLYNVTRIITGFNRPNLAFEVRYTSSQETRLKALQELLADHDGGGILIYTGTRRDAEEVADFAGYLLKFQVPYYHGGLPPEERTRIQDAFMSGSIAVVAATNAFGMGIDRSDVRQVIHYSIPGSLEAYYQEAGRAGRDGLPARAVLLYAPEDRALQEWFIENSTSTVDDLRLLFDALRPFSERKQFVSVDDLSYLTSLPVIKARVGMAELERAGMLEHLGDQGLRFRVQLNRWVDREVREITQRLQKHQAHRRAQLESIVGLCGDQYLPAQYHPAAFRRFRAGHGRSML